MAASAGLLFGKFEVLETLKKDEFAAVYLVHHAFLGKRIVLKVLDTHALPDEATLQRFKGEAKILARLQHPNIITVLDFGVEDHLAYISFEYFEGRSLRSFLRQGDFTTPQKRHVLVQILRGLQYAHVHGVIHRDIKPENIFVSDGLEVRIGDFGLAVTSSESRATNPQFLLGTPCQMSPEQILGGTLTPQSDLFSLGIIAFEMFLGTHPFVGRDVNTSLNNILSFDEEKLFANLDQAPADVQAAIRRLLRKNPRERAPDAGAVLAMLDDAKGGEAAGSGATTRRSPVPAMFGLVVAGTAVMMFLLMRNGEEEPVTAPDHSWPAEASPSGSTDHTIDKREPPPLPPATMVQKLQGMAAVTRPEQRGTSSLQGVSPAREEFGELQVECWPWAEVVIDSVSVETTPLSGPLQLSVGEHEIKLVHAGYPTYSKKVSILPATVTVVRVNLDTLVGYLACEVYPWGEILVDGEPRGQTPLPPIALPPGDHVVTVRNPPLGSLEKTITVSRNDTVRLRHKFEGMQK